MINYFAKIIANLGGGYVPYSEIDKQLLSEIKEAVLRAMDKQKKLLDKNLEALAKHNRKF